MAARPNIYTPKTLHANVVNHQRATRLKLLATPQQEEALDNTSPQYKRAKQYALDTAWNHGDKPSDKITDENTLDDLVYDDLCNNTDLQTGHVQLARDEAASTVDSMVELFYDSDEPNPSKPEFTSPVVDYDKRTLSFREKNGERVASLATVDGRVYPRIEFPAGDDNPQEWYFENDAWEWDTATLVKEEGTYYLHVTCSYEDDEELETESGTVLGVDLNVTGPFAATSTGEFIGSADELNHWRHEYEETRGGLQQTGTHAAHNAVRRVGGRFARWSDHWLHDHANTLVDHAVERGVDGIVFEDLDGIRDRMSDDKKFQQWAFARFVELVTYKARERGVFVEQVPAAYTSQECSRCGYTSRSNLSGKTLDCVCCGREVHRDYDAGVSVAVRYVRLHAGQKRQGGGPPVNAALKSGAIEASDDAVCSVSLAERDNDGSLTSPSLKEASSTCGTSELGRGS